MNGIIKCIGGWVAAAFSTVLLGITFQTQNVLSRLGDIGADVSLSERISMTVYDIQHLGSLYIIFVSIALAVAFLLGGLIYRFTKFGRAIIFIVAGGAAILTMLFIMKSVFFDIHLIAGARNAFGISLQMLAGAMGGLIFAVMTQPKSNRS